MTPVVIFTYDNTFEGLLSCIFFAYEQKIHPSSIISDSKQKPLFFDYSYHIITEEEKSNRVWNKLNIILSSFALRMLFNVWLSELPDRDVTFSLYM